MLDKIARLIVKGTGKALHLPFMEATYTIEQTIEGKLISPIIHKPAKSWVRNPYNFLMRNASCAPNTGAFGAGTLRLREVDGTLHYAGANRWRTPNLSVGYGFRAGIGVTNHGIIIGSSSTAWSFEQYSMQSLIPDGSGSGQIHYNQMAAPSVSYAGTTQTVTVQRYFNNNSGGNITLGEVGLVGAIEAAIGTTSVGYCLFSREVVSPSETFYDKAQLKVTYEISLLYPS